ncbi:MAG: hypothetical protein P9L92_12590 [Candidatus Electryonea clarkiae]|nr:hypothetical protein [Candidatus Electryonea clarkiae]MDP8285048.1 hypothetical protein [Candidatus Electryonea clarkiae]
MTHTRNHSNNTNRIIILLTLLFCASIASAQPLNYYGYESKDWWDTPPRAAYLSYLYRESHVSEWLRDDDAIAYRITTGSISTAQLFIHEEARFTSPLSTQFFFRFHYQRYDDIISTSNIYQENDFAERLKTNRLSVEWRSSIGVTLGLLSDFSFDVNESGFGGLLGYRKSPDRFIRLQYVSHSPQLKKVFKNPSENLDYNGTFSPHQLILEVRYRLNDEIICFLDGFFVPRWEWQFFTITDTYDTFYSESNIAESEDYHLTIRLERHINQHLMGFWISYGEYRWFSHFDSVDKRIWSNIDTRLIKSLKIFYVRKGIKWQWEADLPIEQSLISFEDSSYDSRTITDVIKKERYEVFPQISVRRYFGTIPYVEILALTLFQDLNREIKYPAYLRDRKFSKSKYETNWRVGISAGLDFPGGDVEFAGKTRKIPTGEIRFRVMQNLDRNWIGNFGGGNIIVVFSW